MAGPGVLAPAGNSATRSPAADPHAATAQAPAVFVPFTRGAYEHSEPILDVSQIIDANTHIIGPFDVPAYGYLRGLIVQVNATGGVGGGATVAKFEDAPWSAIAEVVLYDVNGAPIVGPLSGHDLYLLNKWSQVNSDLVAGPVFSDVVVGAGASGNFAFLARIPVEISNRDAAGALPNQASNSTYKCRITMANSAGIYTTAPATTLPTCRWRVALEAWSQPNPTDLMGRPQQAEPPDVGTTMFWTKTTKVIAAGNQTIRLDRVGNLIRDLIVVFRNNTPVRDTVDLPDPIQLLWDGRIVTNEMRDLRRHYMWERFGYAASSLDTGVLVFDQLHDLNGDAGGELRDLWIPTTQGSRLDIVGNFGVAGVLTILTNDVQPVGSIYNPIA
jgi:hypothetical protein